MTTERASCWSITINNPTDADVLCATPGWKLKGQYELGEEGTRHFQGMLSTPQVRFSQVKKAFPRAHIEVARTPAALATYVQKEDTRVGEYVPNNVPSIFAYQTIVADAWNEDEWEERWNMVTTRAVRGGPTPDMDEQALRYIDTIVASQIEAGQLGAEWIAINPMWRNSWKKFWRQIINRHASQTLQRNTPPPQQASQEATQ